MSGGLTVLNNTLLVDDVNLNAIDQKDAEYVRGVVGDKVWELPSKFELEHILQNMSVADAEELITKDFNADKVIITPSKELGMHLIKLENMGLNNEYPLRILIAIHRVYENVKEAQRMAVYLRALGFGLHKEID